MSITADGSQQVVLITGATGAIGQAIARQIAAKPGYAVVLVARNEVKAQQAVREIIRATGNQQVRYEIVDVSRQASVQALVARWQGPLHVLVNNAATTPAAVRKRRKASNCNGPPMYWATSG